MFGVYFHHISYFGYGPRRNFTFYGVKVRIFRIVISRPASEILHKTGAFKEFVCVVVHICSLGLAVLIGTAGRHIN